MFSLNERWYFCTSKSEILKDTNDFVLERYAVPAFQGETSAFRRLFLPPNITAWTIPSSCVNKHTSALFSPSGLIEKIIAGVVRLCGMVTNLSYSNNSCQTNEFNYTELSFCKNYYCPWMSNGFLEKKLQFFEYFTNVFNFKILKYGWNLV